MRHCVALGSLLMLVGCATSPSDRIRGLEPDKVESPAVVGDVYALMNGQPAHNVAKLLTLERLNGTSAWIASEALSKAYRQTLLSGWKISWDGKSFRKPWSIQLVSEQSTYSFVKDGDELAEILNRPLPSDLASRNQVLRLSQLRQQVYRAIADARPNGTVAICVATTTLTNPVLIFRGPFDLKEIDSFCQAYAARYAAKVGARTSTPKDESISVQLVGEVTGDATLRKIDVADNSYGGTSSFYLADYSNIFLAPE